MLLTVMFTPSPTASQCPVVLLRKSPLLQTQSTMEEAPSASVLEPLISRSQNLHSSPLPSGARKAYLPFSQLLHVEAAIPLIEPSKHGRHPLLSALL